MMKNTSDHEGPTIVVVQVLLKEVIIVVVVLVHVMLVEVTTIGEPPALDVGES